MGLKFNPAPGWPVPYGFEPPAGWEPDPDWPPAPPNWPLWIGSDAPSGPSQPPPGGGYVPGYLREQQAGSVPAAPPPGSYTPAHAFRPAPRPSNRRAVRTRVILGAFVAFIVVFGLVAALSGNAHRSSATGHIDKKGQLDVFSLQVGDCFHGPSLSMLGRGFAAVRAVPCGNAHNSQVFAQFGAADPGDYPGHAALAGQAEHGCGKRLAVVNRSKVPRAVKVAFIYPDSVAWFEGHRTISCFIRDSRGDLTGSMLKAGAVR